MLDYLVVLFTPGFGGNHLTNLISLSTNFDKNRVSKDRSEILETYRNSLKVHDEITNMQNEFILEKIKQPKPILICGHIGEYLKAYNYFNRCKNKKFIVLSSNNWVDDLEKIRYRLDALNYYWHKDVWFGWEQHFLYHKEHLYKVLECDREDIIMVNLSDFLNSDISPTLEFISNKLNLKLENIDFCQELHTIWLSNNKIN